MFHTTWFTVYPEDCNYMKVADGSPMVHGGTMLLKMDRAAAELARKNLYNTECDSALTVAVHNLTFHHGAKLGDLIKIVVELQWVGKKRMHYYVECFVENWGGTHKLIADGEFVFCSFKDGKSHPHGLTLEEQK
jgi:acyl-CoA hydrolase